MQDILANEKLVRRILWINGVLLVVAPLTAGLMLSRRAAAGVLLGGLIATLSFLSLKWQLRRAFAKPGQVPNAKGLFISYYLRFLAVVFVVFTVIYYGWVSPVALLVGLSLIVVSISLVGVSEFLSMVFSKRGR